MRWKVNVDINTVLIIINAKFYFWIRSTKLKNEKINFGRSVKWTFERKRRQLNRIEEFLNTGEIIKGKRVYEIK